MPAGAEAGPAVDSPVAVIQALIPLGLEAVAAELTAEVTRQGGPRYSPRGRAARRGPLSLHCTNAHIWLYAALPTVPH